MVWPSYVKTLGNFRMQLFSQICTKFVENMKKIAKY